MIVRILSSGTSFKGAAAYLTHDPEAQTSERVGWTHTLNLANDHVPSAVDEMIWTARDAELLKQEAGIRAGGRTAENPAKHLSLNWSPDDAPTKEHMIETTEGFLRHMNWQNHQAVLVAHTDKEYAHVHVLLNTCHPETGLQLNDDFERRRAQAWALAYEQENGLVYCGQRLKRPGEREDAPTRDAWMAFQENKKEFERVENALRDQASLSADDAKNPKNMFDAEWKRLKEFQRDERQEFFADGKAAFSQLRNSVYQEVRGDFRERWSDYYTACREVENADQLASMKAALLAEQKGALATRRDAACAELRGTRDEFYQHLLGGQRDTRHELHGRQEAGLDSTDFLNQLRAKDFGFREAADAISQRQDSAARSAETEAGMEDRETQAPASSSHLIAHAGAKIGGSALSLLTGWMVELNYGDWVHDTPAQTSANLFEAAADEAQKRQQREAREETDREWREREKTRSWD